MSPLKFCQCNICSAYTTRDSDTGQLVQGTMLSRSQWSSHQQAFKIWTKNPQNQQPVLTEEERFAQSIMTATMQDGGEPPSGASRLRDNAAEVVPPEMPPSTESLAGPSSLEEEMVEASRLDEIQLAGMFIDLIFHTTA